MPQVFTLRGFQSIVSNAEKTKTVPTGSQFLKYSRFMIRYCRGLRTSNQELRCSNRKLNKELKKLKEDLRKAKLKPTRQASKKELPNPDGTYPKKYIRMDKEHGKNYTVIQTDLYWSRVARPDCP